MVHIPLYSYYIYLNQGISMTLDQVRDQFGLIAPDEEVVNRIQQINHLVLTNLLILVECMIGQVL